MQVKWTYVAGLLLAALLVFFLYRKYRVAPDLDRVEMRLADLAGNQVSLEKFRGKPLVLSFAASWCGPCMKELREMNKVSAELLPKISVAVVSDEQVETIKQTLGAKQYPFEFLQLQGRFADIGINSIPTTYFFNSAGTVVKKEVGYIDWGDPSTRGHLLKLMNN